VDARDARLADLIVQAIGECKAISKRAKSFGPSWLREVSEEAVLAMHAYLDSAQAASLPRPSAGAGLGVSRALGEWAQDEAALMALAYEIDQYYKVNCDCARGDH